MTTIRAKMICNAVIPASSGQVANFSAVYSNRDGSRAEENKAFSDATPSANLSMHISASAPAFDKFKQGQAYYMDFIEAP